MYNDTILYNIFKLRYTIGRDDLSGNVFLLNKKAKKSQAVLKLINNM